MKSIEEIARAWPAFAARKPNLPPLPPVGPDRPMYPVPRWALLGATAIVCAAFALCAVWAASAESRRAKALLDRVARAVKLYESDQGAPPAGDATGSAELLKTLCSGSRGRATYFEFQHQDLVDSEGHLVMPDGARVLYRGPLLSEGPSFELRVWSGGKWIAAP